MGEGAALLVLEAEDVARARGAEPYAEVLGYGATSDAHHMVQPRADGREAARAATIALADGGVEPGGDRLGQRPRLVDADRRHRRGAGDRAGARRARGDRAGQRDEGALRPPARGVGRDRGRDLRPGDPRRLGARRRRTSVEPEPEVGDAAAGPPPAQAATGATDRILSTSFGFGGLNAALVFGSVAGG